MVDTAGNIPSYQDEVPSLAYTSAYVWMIRNDT